MPGALWLTVGQLRQTRTSMHHNAPALIVPISTVTCSIAKTFDRSRLGGRQDPCHSAAFRRCVMCSHAVDGGSPVTRWTAASGGRAIGPTMRTHSGDHPQVRCRRGHQASGPGGCRTTRQVPPQTSATWCTAGHLVVHRVVCVARSAKSRSRPSPRSRLGPPLPVAARSARLGSRARSRSPRTSVPMPEEAPVTSATGLLCCHGELLGSFVCRS